jgi:hypothetical protein
MRLATTCMNSLYQLFHWLNASTALLTPYRKYEISAARPIAASEVFKPPQKQAGNVVKIRKSRLQRMDRMAELSPLVSLE